jgi:hypothetical protein
MTHTFRHLPIAVIALSLALAAVASFGAARAEAASLCRAYISTQSGPFEGVVYRSYRTSCPFARNVAAAAMRRIVAAGGAGNGRFTARAYSPVTGRSYRATCSANGDVWTARGAVVDCRAGFGACVLFRAWSV